jgi:hypothetical protein
LLISAVLESSFLLVAGDTIWVEELLIKLKSFNSTLPVISSLRLKKLTHHSETAVKRYIHDFCRIILLHKLNLFIRLLLNLWCLTLSLTVT